MHTEKLICEKMLDMMEERPFYQIKVSQLAERCGISRSTFYSYFDSIFDVVQKIEDDIMEQLIDEQEVELVNDKAKITKALYQIREIIRVLEILNGPNGDPSFEVKFANRNKRVLNMLASKADSKATTLELQVVNEFTRGGKMRVIQWWAENKNSVSSDDMVEIMDKIMKAIHDILW